MGQGNVDGEKVLVILYTKPNVVRASWLFWYVIFHWKREIVYFVCVCEWVSKRERERCWNTHTKTHTKGRSLSSVFRVGKGERIAEEWMNARNVFFNDMEANIETNSTRSNISFARYSNPTYKVMESNGKYTEYVCEQGRSVVIGLVGGWVNRKEHGWPAAECGGLGGVGKALREVSEWVSRIPPVLPCLCLVLLGGEEQSSFVVSAWWHGSNRFPELTEDGESWSNDMLWGYTHCLVGCWDKGGHKHRVARCMDDTDSQSFGLIILTVLYCTVHIHVHVQYNVKSSTPEI